MAVADFDTATAILSVTSGAEPIASFLHATPGLVFGGFPLAAFAMGLICSAALTGNLALETAATPCTVLHQQNVALNDFLLPAIAPAEINQTPAPAAELATRVIQDSEPTETVTHYFHAQCARGFGSHSSLQTGSGG
jgi:hypothetical protein